jgi:hypothetical protein
MADVSNADGAQLRRFHSYHRDRATREGDKFNFVSHAVIVNVDYRADIARLQALGRQIFCQHNAIMFFDHIRQAIGRSFQRQTLRLNFG